MSETIGFDEAVRRLQRATAALREILRLRGETHLGWNNNNEVIPADRVREIARRGLEETPP